MSNSGTELTWYEMPDLRRPLLLVAFEGLLDAAEAATAALDWIRTRTESSAVAMIDPETFFNFQGSADGPHRRRRQPGDRLADHRDLLGDHRLRPGPGGDDRGRAPPPLAQLADHVLEVARRSGCEMVVTVGALISMVPHTRPFSVTGSAVHPDLARRLNLSRPTYQGPTGIAGVINSRLEHSNVPVISLRVEVPHYVPGPPNPKATQALLRRLQQTTGVTTGYEELDSDVAEWMTRVDQAVSSDEESRDYVERLERQVDSDEEMLPTGDDLAAELEAFLRDQHTSDDDPSDSASAPDGEGEDDDVDGDDDGGDGGDGGDGRGVADGESDDADPDSSADAGD